MTKKTEQPDEALLERMESDGFQTFEELMGYSVVVEKRKPDDEPRPASK